MLKMNFTKKFQANIKTTFPGHCLLHGGGGDEDFTFAMAKKLNAALTRNGLEHTFFISGGGHTWANWRICLNNFAL